MKPIIGLLAGLALMLTGAPSQAGKILSVAADVPVNSMSEFLCCGDNLVDMLNQEGLSANYVSGVTDFSSFVVGTTHTDGDSFSWLSFPGVYSGFLILDLGAVYNVANFVMWNGASGIDASVNGFSLTTSLVSDFSVSTFVGSFSGQQATYDATVYDMTDSLARYVRWDIDGNFGNSCCVAVGEIAFDVDAVAAPEPAGLALLGIGLAGIGVSRRTKGA